MDLNLKIDTVENITEAEFNRKYFLPQKPVIIKGLINSTPAFKKWSMEYMREKLGTTVVNVFDNAKKTNSAYTFGDLQMPFCDYIDILLKNQPTAYRLFLFNGFKYCKELKKDFPCPQLFKGLLDHIGFMFFGSKGTKVRMHFDVDMSNVLHTQFVGKKRVLLISQEYNNLLYKTPFNTFSIADFDNPDYTIFPALKYVRGYDVTLEYGDTLYMPEGFWHYMIYEESGFGVAYRKMAHGFENLAAGVLNVSTRMWTDKLMNYIDADAWNEYKKRVAHKRAEDSIGGIKLFKNQVYKE
jgi:ribosomal protein L16 Arg81 hydroxylase